MKECASTSDIPTSQTVQVVTSSVIQSLIVKDMEVQYFSFVSLKGCGGKQFFIQIILYENATEKKALFTLQSPPLLPLQKGSANCNPALH